jgi:hypothetical protein
MSTEQPTPDEVAALLNGLQKESAEQRQPSALEIACGGRLLLVQTPARITLKDGRTFYVEELQAWGYTPFGILGVGNWAPGTGEEEWESRLFAADVIHDIEFDKTKYEEIIEEIKAEEEALRDEQESAESDGEDSAEDDESWAAEAAPAA